jgi:hypothetical protein
MKQPQYVMDSWLECVLLWGTDSLTAIDYLGSGPADEPPRGMP